MYEIILLHCTIGFEPVRLIKPDRQCTPKWILNKADWPLHTNLTANTDTLHSSDSIDEDITHFTDFITQAAEIAIPNTLPISKNHPVPW